jgi:predicted RNA-binding Zn ribbon-like protein
MTHQLGIDGNPGPAGIELVGGALCLDFANTVEGREGPDRRDFLRGPEDLMLWGARAGALSEAEATALASRAPGAFAAALGLREAIYRVFTAIVRAAVPDPDALAEVQQAYAEGMRHARLTPQAGAARAPFAWQWDGEGFDVLRWRISHSAVDLLRSGRLDRLKQCPGGGEGPCNWLFIDTTKGGNRRWCSMADCGGRTKWRRQNARRRASR